MSVLQRLVVCLSYIFLLNFICPFFSSHFFELEIGKELDDIITIRVVSLFTDVTSYHKLATRFGIRIKRITHYKPWYYMLKHIEVGGA